MTYREDQILDKIEKRVEEEGSFLQGEPISWFDIKEEDNKRDWLWEDYIAKRHITLFSALWKAGKTTFLRCLFVAMAHNEELAGQPTKKCRILVISEEDKSEWAYNKEDSTEEEIKDVLIWSRPIKGKPNVKAWERTIEEITDRCLKDKIDLLVIDTLTTFWPIDNENDSAQVTKALIPFFTLTNNNIAVVLVHHFRKGGGDEAQASRGSSALTSFVDNIVEFTRNKDGFPNQRILKTYGRFSSEHEIVIEYTEEGKYITKGEPWQVSKSARLDKILSILRENKQSMSAKEVFNVWNNTIKGLSSRSVRRYLEELLSFNKILIDQEKTVQGGKTPFYAPNDPKQGTLDNSQTPPNVTCPNPIIIDEKLSKATVQGTPKISLTTLDRTGHNPIQEDEDPFAEMDPKDVEKWKGKEPPKSTF